MTEGNRLFDMEGKLPFGVEEERNPEGRIFYVKGGKFLSDDRPQATTLDIHASPEESKALFAPLQDLWHLLQRLRIMRRFTDGRNPELQTKPLPDGSNIPRRLHGLITAWTSHRAWIRMLHYRSLVVGRHKSGRDHLHYIRTCP